MARTGRPTKIDAVVATRPDGTQITASERIVAQVRTGVYHEVAAASAGIHKSTLYDWLRTGARTRQRAATVGLDVHDKTFKATALERRCVDFSDAVAQAEADWEVEALTRLEGLGRGGGVVTTTTTRTDPDGRVETTVRAEEMAPAAQVLEWRLTRRFPSRYGNRIEVDASISDGVRMSAEERASSLSAELRAYLEGAADEQRRLAAEAEQAVD